MRITSCNLLNNEVLKFGDFNVIIGGNGVGKTTILLELFHKSAGPNNIKNYWVKDLNYYSENISSDRDQLLSSLIKQYDRNSNQVYYFSQATKKLDGDIEISPQSRLNTTEYNDIKSQENPEALLNNKKFRKPFISFLSCEARLTLKRLVDITSLDQPPQDPINVLYRNKRLLKEIGYKTKEIFLRNLIILSHNKRSLELGLSYNGEPIFNDASDNIQDEYIKIEEWKEGNFIAIEEAGHGIRSMVRLLMSLLEPVNQIIMIDEPELFLYPSQKRWLGRILVDLAIEQKKQVFLVTHDPMVLQGILDANTKTNIYRVEREERKEGVIKTCELEKITDTNAQRNQEQYLQGLFYQRCIIVEGASDRSFYQNLIEDYEEINDKDLGFIACGGKGSTKHMASIASRVGLKSAFIYDFDILFHSNLITDIFNTIGNGQCPFTVLNDLLNQNSEIANDKGEAEREKKIKRLIGYTNKDSITSEWGLANKQVFIDVINQLSKFGIFIVPYGTLESWAPEAEPKVRFAEIAPDFIRNNEVLNKRFFEFAKKVLSYLNIDI